MDLIEFNEHLTELDLGLEKEDLLLVKAKYDPESKGIIYYEHFCLDVA